MTFRSTKRSTATDIDNRIANNGENAVHGDHDDHADNAPENMFAAGRPPLFVAAVSDELHQSQNEHDERGGKQNVDDRVDDKLADIVQQLNGSHGVG